MAVVLTKEQKRIPRLHKPVQKRIIDYIQEDVPDHLNWFAYAMGATPLVLFVVAAVTGILMTFYYIPYPVKAYESVKEITEGVYLGWFVRGLHKLSINLMIFTLMVHLLRVFITRAYKTSGEIKWLLGAGLFFVTLAMGFTGYSLVYDQVSYWGMTVVMSMIEEIPLVGRPMAYLLRGGEEISQITLLRLYDLHTKLLPLVLVILIGAHILAIRMIGFERIDDSTKTHPFFPDHALKVGAIGVGLLILMTDLVMIFPPVVGPMADPTEVPPEITPPWYFMAVYKWITIAPREPALFCILLFSIIFVLYPFIDRFFANRGYNMVRVNIAVGTSAVMVFVVLTLWDVIRRL